MKSGPLPAVLEHLRKWTSSEGGALSDAELLARFSVGREEAAFAALMRRHGRMVWSVCRHVLRHEQDAEDAFQATFLVLVRKAGSICKGMAIASWLHATAYHIATRARRDAVIRRARESKGESMSPAEPISESAWREVLTILDEEVQRLSERQRAAFVLCSLEGKSLAEAARQLGWKEGTLSGTLSRAREQLGRRLARRGVTLTTVLAGLAVSGESAAPAAVVEKTFRAALAFAAGQSILGGVSPPIASLVREATRSLVVTKLRVLAVVLTAAVAAGGVAGFVGQKPESKQEASASPAVRRAEQPKPETTSQRRTDNYGDPLPPGALARIGTMRFRDGGFIRTLAYSPDGKMLASSGWVYREGVIRLWDAATGKERFLLQPHASYPSSLAFSPDSKMLACMGTTEETSRASISVWDTTTGKLLRTVRHRVAPRWTATFSPDGRCLAVDGADNIVRLLDIDSGKEILQFKGHKGEIWTSAFSPDGKMLATGSNDKTIRLWDATTGKELRRLANMKLPPKHPSSCVAFSPYSKVVAGGSLDGTIQLWDAATGRERLKIAGHDKWRNVPGAGDPCVVVFSPDGKTLAAGNDGVVLDAATGKQRCQLQGFHPDRWICNLVFSPEGKTLAGEDSNRIRFWDPATGKEIFKDAAHRDPVCSLAFAPDSKTLATISYDDSVGLWDAHTGRERFRFQGRVVEEVHNNAIALSPDGRTMAAWLGDGLYSWDLRKRRPNAIRECSAGGGSNYRHGVAFSPRVCLLAALCEYREKQIRLWAEGTAKEPHLLKIDELRITNAFAFSPDGKTLASGLPEGTADLWDIATGKKLRMLPGFLRGGGQYVAVFFVAFSPDGTTLALGGWDGTIGLWDITTGKEFLHLATSNRSRAALVFSGGSTAALAFSPDGKTLAAGFKGGIVCLWELATGKIRREWQAHPDADHFLALAFSPDGRLLALACSDTTVLIWPMSGEPSDRGPKTADLSEKTLEALWTDLAGEDATKAYRAIAVFQTAPRQTVPFLKTHLRPIPAVDAQRLARLIADLDDERFAVRDKASVELKKLEDRAEPALRKALAGQPSLEVRRRIQALLEELNHPLSAEQLREVRAVEALEQIGTLSAQEVLKVVAKGAPGARLTREAKASLQRLTSRAALEP